MCILDWDFIYSPHYCYLKSRDGSITGRIHAHIAISLFCYVLCSYNY